MKTSDSMSRYSFRKKDSPELAEEMRTADPFGKVYTGKQHLFWKQGLRTYALPYARIRRYYRRIEEVTGKTGCCSNDFSMHFLMVRTDEDLLKIGIGDSMYRHEPEHLMEKLRRLMPECPAGTESPLS